MNILPKKCRTCGEWKNRGEFPKNKTYKDGLVGDCKECMKVSRRKRYIENKDRVLESNRQYRQSHIDKLRVTANRWKAANIDKWRKYKRDWNARNKESVYAAYKKWRAENTEQANETRRNWLAANPEKNSIYLENRRARTKGVITEDEWKNLLKKYNHTCLCCGRNDVKLTLDHVIPLFLGGTNTIDNAQPLCGKCNSSKRIKSTDYRGNYG